LEGGGETPLLIGDLKNTRKLEKRRLAAALQIVLASCQRAIHHLFDYEERLPVSIL
jgi:hypothetical protein